jgi:hypothetical protein
MFRKHPTDCFDRLEYYVIRALILVLLLITAYRILDSEIHIGHMISRLVGS